MPKSLTDLLVVYLYENKYLSLPKLGQFEVSDEEDLSQPEQVSFTRIPNQTIQFNYNPEEETDTELIKYITAHTRKMQSLALSDLFTFAEQALQMLNVLQPVSFPGIGTIQKDAKGKVNFSPGIYRPELLQEVDDLSPKSYTEKTSSGSISSLGSSATTRTSSVGNDSPRSMGGMLIILVCVVVAAALIYFIFANKGSEELSNKVDMTQTETKMQGDTATTETASAKKYEEKKYTNRPPQKKGEIQYLIISEKGVDSGRAFHRYRQLSGWGHAVKIFTKDSVHYDVAIPVSSLVSDTTRIKDSIRRLYGHKAIIRYESG